MIRIGAVLFALLFLVGCGSGDGEDSSPGGADGAAAVELEGRTFEGEPVTGQELVPDSKLMVSFEDERVGLNAGCNNMSAPYALTDGRLELTGEMVSTMMGCPKPLQRQDEWLGEFFASAPEVVALDDDRVSLRGEAVEIELTPRRNRVAASRAAAWKATAHDPG